jgi:two-component system, NtrC family, sensor kinase
MNLRLPFHSLRVSVMAHLALLILSAMLLMNGVMIKLAERNMIQDQIQKGRLLLDSLNGMVANEISCNNGSFEKFGADPHIQAEITGKLAAGEYIDALILNKTGVRVFETGFWGQAEKAALSISRECLSTRKLTFAYSGTTWGVLWLGHERIHISAPIWIGGRFAGVTTIGAGLGPLYQSLRSSQRFALIYIALNTIILVLFGVYLLSKTVVKPIYELLNITEEFKDVESALRIQDSSPNEIGQLARSLNLMLTRLDENKRELKDYISSLEKANQDLKKAQDEILQSEKLASVGRLATGVAHEIGNPIGIVLGYLGLLKGDLTQDEKQDFLDRMESEITRINQIVRDLLDFARTSTGNAAQVSVHDLIMETVEMLSPQPMMAHLNVKMELAATHEEVWADQNHLKQVFLNIIMNAADATKEESYLTDNGAGHRLTITTENRGDAIIVKFTDTGPGIKAEEMTRIFDPFYTTKDPGKGTGMGLSVCYRIIKGMGGEIHAESRPDKKTTMVILLPLNQERDISAED